MANEFGVNIAISTNQFRGMWETTIRMLKAGWRMKASSNGTTKVVSDDITAHAWATLVSGGTGSVASITTVVSHPDGKLMTLTGLTGLVSPTVAGGQSEGNYLTLSGSATGANNATHQIVEVLSATSCTVLNLNNSAAVDNSGAISWTEKNVITATYPSAFDTARPWICLEGPHTLQLSCTSAASTDFFRGEAVTQTGTGATGECIGFVYDPLTSAGWMIVMPRTGLFNSSGVLTGGFSGATVTPTAMYRFRRQFVISKGSAADTTTGAEWYQCVREDTEAADIFSTLAANANCTATVPPGGSTTAGNRFPASSNSHVYRCQNNSTNDGATALVYTAGFITSNVTANGRLQVGVANALPRANRSADGSWWLYHGNTLVAGGRGALMMFGRLEGGPDGEAELYAQYNVNSASFSRNIRFGLLSNVFDQTDFYTAANSFTEWTKIYNRSVGSGNGATVTWTGLVPGYTTPTSTSGVPALGRNYGSTQRQTSHPALVAPAFKEPLGFYGGLWGRFRWMFLVQLGSPYDTFESRKYVCLFGYDSTNQYPGVIVGPWDGTSDPTQS